MTYGSSGVASTGSSVKLTSSSRAVSARGASASLRATSAGGTNCGGASLVGPELDRVPNQHVDDVRCRSLCVEAPDRTDRHVEIGCTVDRQEEPGAAVIARHPGQRRTHRSADGGIAGLAADRESIESEGEHLFRKAIGNRRRRAVGRVPPVQHLALGQLEVGADQPQTAPHRLFPEREDDAERHERSRREPACIAPR